MKKIKLDLDRLNVDSFETAAGDDKARGTVHGHYSAPYTCARAATCQYGGTCGSECRSLNDCTWECTYDC
jgi:hypothetical protein